MRVCNNKAIRNALLCPRLLERKPPPPSTGLKRARYLSIVWLIKSDKSKNRYSWVLLCRQLLHTFSLTTCSTAHWRVGGEYWGWLSKNNKQPRFVTWKAAFISAKWKPWKGNGYPFGQLLILPCAIHLTNAWIGLCGPTTLCSTLFKILPYSDQMGLD